MPVPKKVILLKKKVFGRSTCFEKIHVLNNYLFRRKSSSETAAVLKSIYL